ncbi:DUF6313 family protein [Kitasatospora sp. NBC_00085]|uniref:DUF6313 family protein n=1 Tax=unclassified Kitasatospora TaxID=2633591 RepID=UPI00324F6985
MAVKEMRNLTFWLMVIGLPIALVWIVVMIAASQYLGWGEAYNTMVGTASPVGSKEAAWAWLVSVGGWFLVPAFVGGIAGAMIASRMERRRSRSADQIIGTIIHGQITGRIIPNGTGNGAIADSETSHGSSAGTSTGSSDGTAPLE